MALIEEASDYIRKLFRERRYNPSDVISEVALAEQLGMSRTPVRTALFQLEEAGLVEKLAGRGWRVRPLTKEDVEEIFQLKTALEVLAVRLTTERITSAQGDYLMKITERLESAAASGDLDAWLRGDSDFHAHIMEISGNRRLQSTVNALNDQWYRLRPTYMKASGRAEYATQEHRVIAEAIVAHDAAAACGAAAQHMEEVHRSVLRVMDTILDLVGGNTL